MVFISNFFCRKRSRDEDNCDFMPISKRINNLSLRGQCLGEMDTEPQINGTNNNLAANYLMAINNQPIQSNYFATAPVPDHIAINNGSYQQSPHSHHHPSQNPHHLQNHQSHVQSLGLSNEFANGLAIATSVNQHQSQRILHKQQSIHSELNNNEMDGDGRYSPELTADENPYYYSKNKLLFDLHIERERRNQSH